MSTSLTLTLSKDPTLSAFMCGKGFSSGVSGGGPATMGSLVDFQATGLPSKSDPHLACDASGRAFTYSRCTPAAVKSLCDVELQCVSTEYSLPASAPADWPCVVK
jgi:hypothetical protein